MNLLAHIYLSGNNTEVLIGNCIGDFVKGKQYTAYPANVQKGILLHRKIDFYTDNHTLVKKVTKLFNPTQRHYAGVAVDIIFDHILAKNWGQFSNTELKPYTQTFYRLVETHKTLLPDKAQLFFKYMVQYDWLYNYAQQSGIEKVLAGMSRRTTYENTLHSAFDDYTKHQNEIEALFFEFWKDIRTEMKEG